MVILDSYSTHTSHTPEAIFALWSKPMSWPSWDADVREVSFEGPVQLGAKGRMRPRSGPKVSFTVTTFEPETTFTNSSSMPGTSLDFEHIVAPTAEGSQVTVNIRIRGPLRHVWKRIIKSQMNGAARSSVTGLLMHLDNQ